MRYLFTLGFLFTLLSPIFSIENYSTGDKLYVWAISGLNMRAEAGTSAQKTLKIPYSAEVKIVDNQPFSHPFTYTMVQSKTYNGLVQWTVEGHWVKVAYNGQTGFVFDAYLGKYPTITEDISQSPYFELELIKTYGKKCWGGLAEERKTSTLNFDDNARDPDKGRSSSYKLSFKNEAYYESEEESFSGSTTIFIKDMSMAEAYLLFNVLTGFEFKQKEKKGTDTQNGGLQLTSSNENELRFSEEGRDVIIKKVDGGISIQSGGGC